MSDFVCNVCFLRGFGLYSVSARSNDPGPLAVSSSPAHVQCTLPLYPSTWQQSIDGRVFHPREI